MKGILDDEGGARLEEVKLKSFSAPKAFPTEPAFIGKANAFQAGATIQECNSFSHCPANLRSPQRVALKNIVMRLCLPGLVE
jgi:hypothetical protein